MTSGSDDRKFQSKGLSKRRMILGVVFVLGLFIAGSLLGGSALWEILQPSNALNIDGHAPIVYQEVPGLRPEEESVSVSSGISTASIMGQNSWQYYGGDAGGKRFSSVAQITPENVSSLEIAWQYQSGDLRNKPKSLAESAFEATPILVENSLIFCTPFNEVIALNPANGSEKWRFDAAISLQQRPANQYVCRGVSYWKDTNAAVSEACRSRIFMGTNDARLIALDARTGKPCPEFGEQGQVKIDPGMALRWPGEFQITSPPVTSGSVVVVGSAISDNLRVEAPAGVVRAFDARSGKPLWQFDPVPRSADNPSRATWLSPETPSVGHANVWAPMSVDEKRGLIFLPTTSPSPDFYGGLRAGENSYANSVVALNAATGEVVWHFQTVHHDIWDYDLPAQPGVYSVWRNGSRHDVIAQVTKTGLVFVLDRATGKPFLPVEERPVPQQGAPREWLSPTQPFPLEPPPLVPDRITPEEAFGITYWDKQACAKRIRGALRQGLFTPPSEQGTLVYPFTGGGANWGGPAYDPRRNLLVINLSNAIHLVTLISKEDESGPTELRHNAEYAPMQDAPFGMTRELLLSPLGLPCNPPPWGVLAAVDLASGELVWRKVLGTTEDLAPAGLAFKFGTPNFGGPIITAGNLVFIAATMDDYLRAFNVETGAELWKGRLPAGGQATPMTYQWQGRQYVVIAAGGHSFSGTRQGDYVVAFALPESELEPKPE